MSNARKIGKAGEYKFIKWAYQNLTFLPKGERNLEQVRKGGSDVMNLPPFQFEVKYGEQTKSSALYRDWWIQVTEAYIEDRVRVVAMSRPYNPWKFLISAREIGLEYGFVLVEETEFIKWAESQYGLQAHAPARVRERETHTGSDWKAVNPAGSPG